MPDYPSSVLCLEQKTGPQSSPLVVKAVVVRSSSPGLHRAVPSVGVCSAHQDLRLLYMMIS